MGRTFDKGRITSFLDTAGEDSPQNAFQQTSITLPDDLPLFTSVWIKDQGQNQNSRARPYYTVAHYFDKNQKLAAVDCVPVGAGRWNVSDLCLTRQDAPQICGKYDQTVLKFSNVSHFKNSPFVFSSANPNKQIPSEFYPDMLLRRANTLLFGMSSLQYGEPPADSSLLRYGAVFNALGRHEVANGAYDPEISYDPEKQAPLVIDDYLDANDVDRIALIAKNYTAFCNGKRLPVIWPEPGQWGQWPETFKCFVKPQKGRVDLSWRRAHPSLRSTDGRAFDL